MERNGFCIKTISALVLPFGLAACGAGTGSPSAPAGLRVEALTVTSASFPKGEVALEFTCDGKDNSPELTWSAPPPGTRSLAVFATDPDAAGGEFVHWIVFNIPNVRFGIPAGVPVQTLGAREGMNDFGSPSYRGPCPPRMEVHRYAFRVFALDRELDLPESTSKERFLAALSGHVLAEGRLLATFAR